MTSTALRVPRRWRVVGFVLLAAIAGWTAWRHLAPHAELVRAVSVRQADIEIVIPHRDRTDAEPVDSVGRLPDPLVVHVGQTIRIRNLDAASQQVGPFFVRAHETVTQRFLTEGRLAGVCPLHPTGRLEIDIRP